MALRNGDGDHVFKTCSSSHQEADLQSIQVRQLPVFLAGPGQTRRIAGHVNFRTEFEGSRPAELAEPGLETAGSASSSANKKTGPDQGDPWRRRRELLLPSGRGIAQGRREETQREMGFVGC